MVAKTKTDKTAVSKKTAKTTKASSKRKAPSKASSTISAGTLFVGDIPAYQPKKTEEYMSAAMQGHFKEILSAWKQQLQENAESTLHNMQDTAGNHPDPNDRASQEEGFALELRTRDRERKLIRKIEETLDLIDKHGYGFCDECGEEIGLRRLEARPTATLCVDCKALDEIKEKQLGSA